MMSRPHILITLALAVCTSLIARAEPAAAPASKPDPACRSAMMIDSLREKLAAEEPRIKEQMNRIDAELKALDRATLNNTDWAKEWAGEYYEGDSLGTNVTIRLAPKAGIAFLNYGCLGLYGGDHGEIVQSLPDGLQLKLTFGDDHNSYLSERIHFVRWGDERFLVPAWLLPEFVNNYNRGGYARSAMYRIPRLIRNGQYHRWFSTPQGLPELPPEYAKLLMSAPVNLKVTAISPLTTRHVTGNVNRASCEIQFEGGSDKGIYIGMTFRYPKDLGLPVGEILITSITEAASTGRFVAFISGDQKVRLPEVGETISTTDDEGRPIAPPQAPKSMENEQPSQ